MEVPQELGWLGGEFTGVLLRQGGKNQENYKFPTGWPMKIVFNTYDKIVTSWF